MDPLSVSTAPQASATHALVNVTNTALSGASANGTYIGANPAAASADFINYQVGGTTKFKVDLNGVIPVTAGLTGVNASALPMSSITAATGANTINNGNNAQTWDWNSAATSLTVSNAGAGTSLAVANTGTGYAAAFTGGNVGIGTTVRTMTLTLNRRLSRRSTLAAVPVMAQGCR